MNVFDVLREKSGKLICHDNNRKTVYLEDVNEIVNQVEQEYNNGADRLCLPPEEIVIKLKEYCSRYNVEMHNRPLDYNFVLELLSKAEKHSNWIPCSERLPKEHEHVLICVHYNGKYSMVGYYDKDFGWYGQWGAYVYNQVIAWQPLPEPYKEVGIK